MPEEVEMVIDERERSVSCASRAEEVERER